MCLSSIFSVIHPSLSLYIAVLLLLVKALPPLSFPLHSTCGQTFLSPELPSSLNHLVLFYFPDFCSYIRLYAHTYILKIRNRKQEIRHCHLGFRSSFIINSWRLKGKQPSRALNITPCQQYPYHPYLKVDKFFLVLFHHLFLVSEITFFIFFKTLPFTPKQSNHSTKLRLKHEYGDISFSKILSGYHVELRNKRRDLNLLSRFSSCNISIHSQRPSLLTVHFPWLSSGHGQIIFNLHSFICHCLKNTTAFFRFLCSFHILLSRLFSLKEIP